MNKFQHLAGEELIIAELQYVIDSMEWGAVVTESDEGVFQLWFLHGSRYAKSGQFTNGKALVKYIREKANEKIKDRNHKLVSDTLDQLKKTNAINVVPVCYSQFGITHARNCNNCPYRKECETNTEFQKQVKAYDEENPPEDEGDFMDRLQNKLAKKSWNKWEGGN